MNASMIILNIYKYKYIYVLIQKLIQIYLSLFITHWYIPMSLNYTQNKTLEIYMQFHLQS